MLRKRDTNVRQDIYNLYFQGEESGGGDQIIKKMFIAVYVNISKQHIAHIKLIKY